jgi:hypothetical protein
MQTAITNRVPALANAGFLTLCRRKDLRILLIQGGRWRKDHATILNRRESSDCLLDLVRIPNVDWGHLYPNQRRRRLDGAEQANADGRQGIRMTTTRVIAGAICLRSSSRLPPKLYSIAVNQ